MSNIPVVAVGKPRAVESKSSASHKYGMSCSLLELGNLACSSYCVEIGIMFPETTRIYRYPPEPTPKPLTGAETGIPGSSRGRPHISAPLFGFTDSSLNNINLTPRTKQISAHWIQDKDSLT